jgi:PAS domain S-box-containing protein
MSFQYIPYIWPFFISAVVTFFLAVYAFRHRNNTGAFLFGLCMLVTCLWTAGYLLEMTGTDYETQIFWNKTEVIFYSLAPLTWFLMVLRFVGLDRWMNRRNILLLILIPVITIILAWTNEWHSLIWRFPHLSYSGFYPVLEKSYGAAFILFAIYSYFLNILSVTLLGRSLLRRSSLYRQQALALLVGLLLMFVPNLLFIMGFELFGGYDLTLIAAGISGIIIAWGIFRFRLFDIVPVARDRIVENMIDGLIVLDASNRIADMNAAAKNIFGITASVPIGQDTAVLYNLRPEFEIFNSNRQNMNGEFVVGSGSSKKIYEISTLSLRDRVGKSNGLIFSLHDVTEQRNTQARLLEQEKTLAKAEERENLSRNLHDSVTQSLYSLNALSEATQVHMESGSYRNAEQTLKRISEITHQALKEMRLFIYELRPPELEKGGLVAALQYRLAAVEGRSGVQARILADEEFAFSAETEDGLYQIAQEALNNILKHARARSIEVKIFRREKSVVMELIDDGKGFDTAYPSPGGMGLNNMRQRACRIGGELEIISAPAQGTTVRVCIFPDKEVCK